MSPKENPVLAGSVVAGADGLAPKENPVLAGSDVAGADGLAPKENPVAAGLLPTLPNATLNKNNIFEHAYFN